MSDILGIVARAHASPACAGVAKEVAQIGKWVCNSHEVQYHEKSLRRYSHAVTQIDLAFLESVRDYCATGLEAFDAIGKNNSEDEKQVNIDSRHLKIYNSLQYLGSYTIGRIFDFCSLQVGLTT